MKRYALFAGDVYYPAGGWIDLVDFYDVMDDAKRHGIEAYGDGRMEWWHVVDMTTGKIVCDDRSSRKEPTP